MLDLQSFRPAPYSLTSLDGDIRKIRSNSTHVHVFSIVGVDIFQKSDWSRVAYASLSNVIGGAVNDNGVYLATSSAGVYLLPLISLSGDVTGDLVQTYTPTSTPAIQSDNVTDIDARGTGLIIGTDAGLDYLPNTSTVYGAAITGLGHISIGDTRFAFLYSDVLYSLAFPSAAWTLDDCTPLSYSGADDDFELPDGSQPDPARWILSIPAQLSFFFDCGTF